MSISKLDREELDALESTQSSYRSKRKRERIAELKTLLKMEENNLDTTKDWARYYEIQEQERDKVFEKYLQLAGVKTEEERLSLIHKHKKQFKIFFVITMLGLIEIATKGAFSRAIGFAVLYVISLFTNSDVRILITTIIISVLNLILQMFFPIWLFIAIYEHKSYRKYEN